jgi:hypothetical protein
MKHKTANLRDFLRKNPEEKAQDVAKKFGVSSAYVYQMRSKMRRELFPPSVMAAASVMAAGDVVKVDEALVQDGVFSPPVKVDAVLDTRAVQYGTFADGAALMQSLKRTLSSHAQAHNKTFADDQWEALEMIVHKMARIVNGNPDNVDSWTDIAGYATLIADRLQGNAR